jgi:type I restriction enzyme S subunit
MLMWKRGLGVSEYDGIVSPAYSVFSFNKSFPKYYHYLFRTDQYVSEFKRNSRGVIESRLRLYDDMFGSIYSHFPPIQEQEQIVKYLDDKTYIIDKLISTKERKIELLKEQRTTLINEVITKGLNPNVKMEDSGVEWIGDIPENWNTLKLKYEYKIQKGRIPKTISEKMDEGLVPYLSMEVLRGSDTSSYVSNDDGVFVNEGQTLILWDGSNSGEIIKVEKDGILSSTMGVLNKIGNKLNEDFSFYQLKSHEPEIRNNTNGMGIPHVDGQYVRSLVLLTPPIQEQEQIVEYLDKHTKEIDDLVSMEQKKIELLKEYRQSLISEVITGKIKVV